MCNKILLGLSIIILAGLFLGCQMEEDVAPTYTVIFDSNNGTGETTSVTFTYGQAQNLAGTIFGPPDFETPEQRMYFAGWALASDGSVEHFGGESVSRLTDGDSITLYARWGYRVVFNADGGSPAPDSQIILDGNKAAKPPAMTKPNNSFDYWHRNGVDEAWDFGNDVVTESFTLYAKWIPSGEGGDSSYTVTFNINNAGGIAPEQKTVTAGTTITLPDQSGFARSGYSFGGWNTSASGMETHYASGAGYTPTGSITLYAEWTAYKLTISYANGGGTGTAPSSPVSADYGTNVTMPPNTYTRTDWNFAGWAVSGAGSLAGTYAAGTDVSVANLSSAIAGGDAGITLTATWSQYSLNISYSDGGGTGTAPSSPTSAPAGTDVTMPANTYTRTGYTFAGWAVSGTNAIPNTYAAGASVPVANLTSGINSGNQSITLTATWSNNAYVVSFDSNGGSPVGSIGADYGSTINAPAIPNRGGYDFAGWYRDNTSFNTSFNFGSGGDIITGSITLYAKWTCKVTFLANNGGGSPPNAITVTAGSSITIPTQEGLSRGGYDFAGWNINSGGTGSNYVYPASYVPTGHIDLYAHWTCTVSYNLNGGGGTLPSPVTVNADSSVTLDSGGGLSRAGTGGASAYTFDGWSATANGAKLGSPYAPVGHIILYARWTSTVSYNLNYGSGTTPGSETVVSDSYITLPSGNGLSRAGTNGGSIYNFDGWSIAADGAALSSSYMPTGNITLYARWTSTVSYSLNSGSGTLPSSVTVVAGSGLTLNNGSGLSRAGTNGNYYSYAGWNTSTYGTGDTYSGYYTPTGNITLYALWTSTVSYDQNGGNGGPPSSQTVPAGTAVTIPGQSYGRRGHNFGGWNTRSDGMGDTYSGSYTPAGNITLYSRWIKITNVYSDAGLGPNPTLNLQFNWLDDNVLSNTVYEFQVYADEVLAPRYLGYSGYYDVTVNISSSGPAYTLSVGMVGYFMFQIDYWYTLSLGNNITLKGWNNSYTSNYPVVIVNYNSKLIMNTGSMITGNNNVSNNYGGGVRVNNGGDFEMKDGTITLNQAVRGGGVYVDGGTFTQSGGTISSNYATFSNSCAGGGVYVNSGGSFTMKGGTITANLATSYGYGAGVCVESGRFIKQGSSSVPGGYIYSNQVVADSLQQRGWQAYVLAPTVRRKESAAATTITLDSNSGTNWDY